MQGSFWKTVAIVGVIGIGSLAILEVQHRLQQQTAETDAPDAADVAAAIDAATGDQTVDAMLSDSEFERLLKGQPATEQSNPAGADIVADDTAASSNANSSAAASSSQTARFSMDEPALAQTSATPAPDSEGFFNSEPVAPQNAMPPVNNTVRMDQLAEGGNPFGAEDESNSGGVTVAANYESDSSSPLGKVQATGFEKTEVPPASGNLPTDSPAAADMTAQNSGAFSDAFEEFSAAATQAATPIDDSAAAEANSFDAADFSDTAANSAAPSASPSDGGPRPVQVAELNPTPQQTATGSQAGKFAFFSGNGEESQSPESQSPEFQSPDSRSATGQLKQTPSATATAEMFEDERSKRDGQQPVSPEPTSAGNAATAARQSGATAPMFEDAAPAFDMEETPSALEPAANPAARPGKPAGSDFSPFDDSNSNVAPNPATGGFQSQPQTPSPTPAEGSRSERREFGGATFSEDDKGSASVPFADDGVPLPRPEPTEFGSDQPDRDMRVPAQRQPESAPVLQDSGLDNNKLPFAEDTPQRPATNLVPALDPPSSISIPDFGSGSQNSGHSESRFDSDSRFESDSRSEPGSRSQPEAKPRFEPQPEPAGREFGSPFDQAPDRNSEPRNSAPRSRFDDPSSPSSNSGDSGLNNSRSPGLSQPSSGGTREFGAGGPMFDADDDIQPVPSQRDIPRTTPDRSQPDFRFDDLSPGPAPRERQPVPAPRDNSRLNDRLLQPIPGRDDRDFGNSNPLPGLPGFDPQRRTQLVAGEMRPNLVLEKQAPENATVGTPLDYRILVKNEGNAIAYDVVVEDEVTSAARVDGAHPQSEFDTASKKLMWTFETVEPGEQKEITVRVTPTGEGVMDGLASVRFKSRVQATTVITAPKLRLQMAGPDEVRMGEQVAYRYIITNEGSGEARDVFIRTVLPATGGLTHPQGRDLEYEIQAMRPGEQREISLAVVAAEPGEHKTEAEVTVGGNPADQAAWRTNVVGAQLQIVRRGPKRRFVGRSATYENIVTNETRFEALDAKVVETVPQGMRFMGATLGGQYDEANRTVTWRINRLGPGRQEQLQLELMPTESGSMESVVRVLENVGVQGEDYVSTTIVEDLHNVSATISQLEGPVALGETFGFTIIIDNRGTAEATDVELRVEVPEEIQVVGAGSREVPANLLGGNVVQYDVIVRIEPNRKQSFELKLRGEKPIRNGVVKAHLQYKQMNEPLIVSESVTIYREDL